MIHKRFINNKGFTFIEMVLSLVILATVSYALVQFVMLQYSGATEEATKAKLNQEAKNAVEKIVDEMRRSSGTTPTSTGITLYPNTTLDTPITDTVSVPGLVVINFEQTDGSYKEVCYKLEGNELKRFDLGASNGQTSAASNVYPLIAKDGYKQQVDSFSVKLDSNNSADNFVKYVISLQVSGGPATKKIVVTQTATVIRNKTPN